MSSRASFLSTIRKDFVGSSDPEVNTAILENSFLSVSGVALTKSDKDSYRLRVQRYRKAWRFYRGEQWARNVRDGERKQTINLCRKIVNKSTDWLFGQPFRIIAPSGNEGVAEFCEAIWKDNNKETLSWRIGQVGSVTGDVFLQVTTEDVDKFGNPLKKPRIVIRLIPPQFVIPIYDPADSSRMVEALIQFPISVQTVANAPRGRVRGDSVIYTQHITQDAVREFINREEIKSRRIPNPIGEVNIVHIRNCVDGDRIGGMGDLEDLFELQEDVNAIATDIKEVIDYHAAPTTLIFGARSSEMSKSANKVWSGLPKDARVENLRLEGDLVAARNYLDILLQHAFEISNTPEKSLGGDLALANVSGAALQTALMPLVEKTRRKRLFYREGLIHVNRLILLFAGALGEKIPVAREDQAFETDIEFGNPLPIDEREKINLIREKLSLGLESRVNALRQLHSRNLRERAIEILSDRRQDFLADIERAKAASPDGKSPNLSIFGLGSIALSQGLTDAFAEMDSLLTERDIQREIIRELSSQAIQDTVSTSSEPSPSESGSPEAPSGNPQTP